MMNIIFLDIDGVLNSMAYFESLKTRTARDEISDYHLKLLAELYHSCDAKIVLSSTWRDLDKPHEDCYKMYHYLENCLAKYDMCIFSQTPIVNGERPKEIKTWLTNHSNISHYVSLDDDFCSEDYRKYGIEKCLIATKFFCKKLEDGGLQPIHIEKAKKILLST